MSAWELCLASAGLSGSLKPSDVQAGKESLISRNLGLQHGLPQTSLYSKSTHYGRTRLAVQSLERVRETEPVVTSSQGQKWAGIEQNLGHVQIAVVTDL